MANRIVDITGRRFGRLVAVRLTTERRSKQCVWECICDCGKAVLVPAGSLRQGSKKSCGCLLRGSRRCRSHGMSGSPTYKSWEAMKQRCSNPNNTRYADYGGRGITVCDRWQSFEHFLQDMGERPDGTTLDRVDNNLGYCPENCCWSTPKQQCSNRRKPRSRADVGVYFDSRKKKKQWYAEIKRLGVKQFLGYYGTKEEAMQARRQVEGGR